MSYYILQPVFAGILVVAGVLLGAGALRAFSNGRVRAGIRRTGWALVPFGLLAVGVAGLGARIVAAVTRWGFGLVFSPVSWFGVILIVLGGLLVLLTRERGSDVEAGEPLRTPTSPPRAEARNPYASLPSTAAPASARKPAGASGRKGGSTTDPGASGLLAELEEMGLLDDDR